MNILYTLNFGQPGGTEKHTLDLVKGMIARGHTVTVVCAAGPIVDWYKTAGAIVFAEKIRFEIDPIYIFRLISIIKHHKIDIIHSHDLKASANSMLAGFLSRTPIRITHIHTPISEWKAPNPLKAFYTFLASVGYAIETALLSTYEIALTESRKKAKIAEGILQSKLKVLPNGIDLKSFNVPIEQKRNYRAEILAKYKIPQNAFIIGTVARLTEEKGTDVLLKGFAQFLTKLSVEEKATMHLVLAGGGKLKSDMQQLSASLGLDSQVTITGVFDESDKLKFYASFNVFVFPSLAEGFGIVLLEAMASRLPILCSNLTVLAEVGGSTVFTFATGDSTDLAQKLYDLYKRKADYAVLGENAHHRVAELFTMEKFIDAYENLYKECLAK